MLRSVEADVNMVQAWCKGEGQLQVCVVLNKEMAMSELKKVEQEHTRTMEVGWVSCTYVRVRVQTSKTTCSGKEWGEFL